MLAVGQPALGAEDRDRDQLDGEIAEDECDQVSRP